MKKFICVAFLNLISLMMIQSCRREDAGVHGPAQHIKVVMKRYAIQPAIIALKSGGTVELEISTADVQHGFDVPQLGIKEPVQPGRSSIITFKVPAKGQYNVVCGIVCGPHHDDMSATLVVQ